MNPIRIFQGEMVPSLLLLCLLVTAGNAQKSPAPSPVPSPTPSRRPTWLTLSGDAPLVIANGGLSGLLPDQTVAAYNLALNLITPGSVQLCNLQLSKDGRGICRGPSLDLSPTTDITIKFPNPSKTYTVNGSPVQGNFSIDYTLKQLLTLQAIQPSLSRPNVQGNFSVTTPEVVASLLQSYSNFTGNGAFLWLNVEYPKFYEDNKLNITGYALSSIKNLAPAYISSPEIGFLQKIRGKIGNTLPIFKIPVEDLTVSEPTTNMSYGDILGNMSNIRRFASGIMVPKDLIWPLTIPNQNPTQMSAFVQAPSTLVEDAHAAKLEVHAYNFVNDPQTIVFNYSFDPIKEHLNFIKGPGFSVDGIVTDFSTTSSVAIECYANERKVNETSAKSVRKPFNGKQVITHSGGDSGNFPGSTNISLQSAINKGADYIDCPVQMTKDGIAICRQAPNLILTTTASSSAFVSEEREVPFIGGKGIFTFDLTLEQIKTLKANIYSPQQSNEVFRNTEYDGTHDILTLTEFLDIAKSSPRVGIYIVLENAYELNGTLGIDTVSAVVSTLKQEGLDNSTDVVIQSEDAVVLRALKNQVSATLIYSLSGVTSTTPTPDSVLKEITEFASGVAVGRSFVSPSVDAGFLLNPTQVVKTFHSHNLSVLVVYFRNEFVSIPFDFQADPTLELQTYVQLYGIDGVVTDFPGTAKSYLTNPCKNPSNTSYTIPTVNPGEFLAVFQGEVPAEGPAGPPLGIAEPPIVPIGAAPTPTPPAPAPGAPKNSASISGVQVLLVTVIAAAVTTYHHLW